MTDDLSRWLESQEFYEICQRYRWSPLTNQEEATKAFENLKKAILEHAHRQ